MSKPSQVAIVTGGNSGIGQAISLALAQIGFQVVVVGTNSHKIEKTLTNLSLLNENLSHLGLALDVQREEDMSLMVAKTLERFSRIDLLVASAGIGKKSGSTRIIPYPTVSLPLDEWQEILDVNLTGIFLSNRAVVPVMKAQQSGQIINICSSTTRHGLRGQLFAPSYCASKFGVVGLTESLAEEVRPNGIRVQAIFPGPVKTPLLEQTALTKLFGGRAILPENLSAVVVYLVQQPLDVVVVHPYVLPWLGITQ